MAEKKIICESQEGLYQKAVKKMNADRVIVQHAYKIENYLIAAGMFEEVGDFEDAAELASRCRRLADQTREEEKAEKYASTIERIKGEPEEDIWKKAEAAFAGLGDYKDSAQQAQRCRQKVEVFEKKYRRKRGMILGCIGAVVLLILAGSFTGFFKYVLGWGMYKGGMYNNALEIFEKKQGFLNADVLAEKCRKGLLGESDEGDEFLYGKYKWKVLDRDGDIITAITSAVGDDHDFYSVAFDVNGSGSWAESSLREWLNTTIYEEAFNDEERAALLPIVSEGSKNEQYQDAWTEETTDYLTLLSADQVSEYEEQLKTLGLNYWLRTPGHEAGTAAYISAGKHQAMLYGYPVDSDELSVRAVIRIDCSAIL